MEMACSWTTYVCWTPVRAPLPSVPRCLCCPPHTSPAFSAHHCWLLLPPSERTPPARASHSCNMLGGSLVVFGGNDAAALFNDVWVCDPGTSPTLTCGECVCVSLMHCIMVCAATGAWNEPTVVGTPPTPRSTHSAAVYGSRMFVFGGATGAGEHLSDGLHVLEDSGGTGKLVWCVWCVRGVNARKVSHRQWLCSHVVVWRPGIVQRTLARLRRLGVATLPCSWRTACSCGEATTTRATLVTCTSSPLAARVRLSLRLRTRA